MTTTPDMGATTAAIVPTLASTVKVSDAVLRNPFIRLDPKDNVEIHADVRSRQRSLLFVFDNLGVDDVALRRRAGLGRRQAREPRSSRPQFFRQQFEFRAARRVLAPDQHDFADRVA